MIALLLLHWGLLILGGRALSLTLDEPSHLAAGYSFLARGALWTIPERGHPLLIDAWEALPFYLGHPDIPVETLAGWGTDYLAYAIAFTDVVEPWLPQVEVAIRVPAMLLSVLLAAVVYRWAGQLWGRRVGLVALAILILDPTLLAHGRLATNDVGVTALGTLSLYLLWTWRRAPAWPRAMAVGSLWGATLLAKGSGLLWVAAGMLATGWMMWRRDHQMRERWLQWLAMGLIAGLVLWAGHGFTWGYLPDLPKIPVPAPAYWEGLLYQAEHSDKPLTYALGRWRETGWIGYFPLAFLIKNPLPFLLALLIGIVQWARQPRRRRALYLPVFFGAFYGLIAILMGPNLGYRHIYPIHPTFYLLAGSGLSDVWRQRRRWARGAIVALGVWYCGGALRIYPFEAVYYNEIVGGAREGWRYLEGQRGHGWHALRDFETEAGVAPSEIAFAGWEGYTRSAPKDLWGKPLPPARGSHATFEPALYPAPGHYIISANALSGPILLNPDSYAWFRYHAPDAVIAESLFYYHVTAEEAPTWLAQCNQPYAPLYDGAIQEGFGDLALRTFEFDCRHTWIYPDGGESRGAYALHADLLQPPTVRERLALQPSRPADPFTSRHLTLARQSYRQWDSSIWPAMALYEWPPTPPAAPLPTTLTVAPAEAVPATLSKGSTLTSPLPLADSFIFRGSRNVSINAGMVELETWWDVTGQPITRPLSIMAHLITGEGAALGVADGLGVASDALKSGDLVVQRHQFEVTAVESQLWLRTGIYFLDTMERIPVTTSADAIFIPITEQ